MGQIKKAAGPKHEATVSPAISDFVARATGVPIPQLPAYLNTFPQRWPLPRGDLYHWIPLLNRFDNIFEEVMKEYGLDLGPQAKQFGTVVLERGVAEENEAAGTQPITRKDLEALGFQEDGDRQLVESVLHFSRTLLENCGNRSLYASSERLGDLLNTTSLSLLSSVLQLMVRLAQRFHASRQRSSNASQSFNNALLASHYNIDLEKVQKLAEPFVKPQTSQHKQPASSKKGKEKAEFSRRASVGANANDMLELLQSTGPSRNGSAIPSEKYQSTEVDGSKWEDWGDISLNYYRTTPSKDEAKPITPSMARRASILSRQSRLSMSEDSSEAGPTVNGEKPDEKAAGTSRVEFSATQIKQTPLEVLVRGFLADLPKDVKFDFLARLRVAGAIMGSCQSRQEIVSIRLLALTNLAYIYPEDTFKQKILQRDSDEPRQLQLVQQLCDLLNPPADRAVSVSLELQTIALGTLEAFAKLKGKAPEVCAALNVNVNHGVLFHLLRSAVTEMKNETGEEVDIKRDEWREAGFALLETLPTCTPRTGEALISAGLLNILVEVLKLRTPRAERSFPKTLTFLNNLVGPVRDAFETLASADGLEAISSLMAYQVNTALERAQTGQGLPAEYRNRVTDYQIPFSSQQTLRMIFKITREMMANNNGNFSRLLRNYIESPNLLGGLRTVMINPVIFGASVWSGAVNIMSSFIHNEPTSYTVVSEAGLSRGFLDTLSTVPIDASPNSQTPGESGASNSEQAGQARDPSVPEDMAGPQADVATLMPYFAKKLSMGLPSRTDVLAKGILPAADAIISIPNALGALCLNHAGMELLKQTNALDNFFDIFESPTHVRTMTSEQELAQVLGNSFDELVRHHPTLKILVLSSLLRMIVRIKTLCLAKGKKASSGAKLWVQASNDEVRPAGQTAGENEGDEDVTMSDVDLDDGDIHEVLSADTPLPTSADGSDEADGVSILSYINVAMKFLGGFAENPAMCGLLVDSGAADLVLDLATMPVLRYDCNNHMALMEVRRVLQSFAEHRPHLVLPAIVQQTKSALEKLDPLSRHDGPDSFFAGFTTSGTSSVFQSPSSSLAKRGTSVAQSLVRVHTLITILSEVLSSPSYNPRGDKIPFNSVNLADVYAELVTSLGFLHRVCVWEEILLMKRLPDAWMKTTAVKGYGMGSSEADQIFGLTDASDGMPGLEPADDDGTNADRPSNGISTSESSSKKSPTGDNEKSAAFRNTRTLRYLLSQVPSSAVIFLQNLGRCLLGKRRSHSTDAYTRQNASFVADAISSAYTSMFTYGPPHEASRTLLHSYWIVVLTSASRLLVEGDRNQGQVLTLLLHAFRKDGGLEIIRDILRAFHDEVESISSSSRETPSNENTTRLFSAYQGIQVILNFYKPILSSKSVAESSQSVAMMTNDSRPTNHFHFNSTQFLVELRAAVLPVVKSLWESSFVENASSNITKSVIEIMRIILDAADEVGVPRQVPEQSQHTHKVYEISSDKTDTLRAKGFDEETAQEALYRCYNDARAAAAYCQRLSSIAPHSHLPVPDYDKKRVENTSQPPAPTTADSQPVHPSQPSAEITLPRMIDEDTNEAAEGLALLSQGDRLQLGPPTVMGTLNSQAQPSSSTNAPPAAPAVTANPESLSNDHMELSLDNLQSMLPDVQGQSTQELFQRFADALHRNPSASREASRVLSRPVPSVTTKTAIDDLNNNRAEVRKDLVDRALEILNRHEDVTFELADLFNAATSKVPDVKAVRAEIGATLIQALISFELDEHDSAAGKKIASYANLLALVLQDKDFFEACSTELMENFEYFISFIKLPSNVPAGISTSPWICQTLLVIEKILSEDAQPPQVSWTFPGPEGNPASNEIFDFQPPLVTGEAKSDLFEALLKLMPSTGKDEPMVLSITRTLVILTRDREIASRLGEKKNIQRFFLMIKQLSGMTEDKLPSSVMVVIRHMFENDNIIRRVMRSEIRNNFDSRPNRPTDITSYAKQMNHLAIRAPQIFEEVSNEVLEIIGYDATQKPQALRLKPETPTEPQSVPAAEPSNADDESKKDTGEDQEMTDKAHSIEGDQTTAPKGKQVEKAPSVEHPSGVTHYLLSELLSYKETDDSIGPTQPKFNNEASMMSTAETQPVANGTSTLTGQPSSDSSQNPPVSPASPSPSAPSDSKKAELKPGQHPIHTYRCFLLQCLAELLHSYNQAKVEFINFSRKADAKASTPSKPRSGVLNYLLNDAVPVGTVNIEDTVAYRKREATSNWAMAVVVALCLRTNEDGYKHKSGAVEEEDQPDLVFVRKFVLEHTLKAFKDAASSDEDLTSKYGRLLDLADLFSRLLSGQLLIKSMYPPSGIELGPQKAIAKIMFEKNFIAALTSAVADINLNFKGADRAIKYILRPLKYLTTTAVELSESSSISTAPGPSDEDDISSATSVSEVDDGREETPDLFRNSTLGMFEPNRENGSSSEESRSEDEEMYDDEYDEGMEYDDGMDDADPGDVISDEDEDLDEVGHIEGMNGERHMDIIVDEEVEDDDIENDEEDDLDGESDEDDAMDDLEEINGDGENSSLADDNGEDWQDEDDIEGGMDDDGLDESGELGSEGAIEQVVHEMGGPEAALQRLEGLGGTPADLIRDVEEGRYMDDVVRPDDEEDEDDEDEGEDEDEGFVAPEYDDHAHGGMDIGMLDPPLGWDDIDDDNFGHGHHRHHHHTSRHPLGRHHHHLPDPWTIFPNGPPRGPPLYRSHRAPSGPRSVDDGSNPLLRRGDRSPGSGAPRSSAFPDAAVNLGDSLFSNVPGGPGAGMRESPAALVHQLLAAIGQGNPGITAIPGPGGNLHIQITGRPGDDITSPGSLHRGIQAIISDPRRMHAPDSARNGGRSNVAAFIPQDTWQRWSEEAKMLFGANDVQNRGSRVTNALLRLMVPPAIERKKEQEALQKRLREEAEKRKEQEKKEREDQERKEKEEREKKEAEEAAEAEAAAAAARAQPTAPIGIEAGGTTEGLMEGVEQDTARAEPARGTAEASQADQPTDEPSSLPTERQYVEFNGAQLDITDMGIDRAYLEALPEDIRNEVLMSQLAMQRAQTAAAGEPPTEIDNEFLEALPADVRAEVLQQEAQQRRQREREEARRQQSVAGGIARAEEMDPASFFASLDPTFRQTVLMEQDEDMLAQLPPDIAAEARALAGDRGIGYRFGGGRLTRPRQNDYTTRRLESARKPARKQIVQMLDKPGVATLVRLMFMQQQSNIKIPLNGILHDVVQNRQSRAEVIGLLLSLLHDSSTDANAVERSFTQLSMRAKQPSTSRTPLKRTITDTSVASIPAPSDLKVTPVMVIQQCLGSLASLSLHNIHIPSFFLNENDISFAIKGKTSKKGKGKETKPSKYPINALLALLDRSVVTDNMNCVEQLADLLQRITYPLTMLLRREKEEKKDDKELEPQAQTDQANDIAAGEASDQPSTEQPASENNETLGQDITSATLDVQATSAGSTEGHEQAEASDTANTESQAKLEASAENKDKVASKRPRTPTPPVIPEENLALVINIIMARECPSTTFRATLSTMTNLSSIPGAKDIFGKRLVACALELGQLVLRDLNELIPQIKDAASGNDLRAMALTKFSPQSSDQAKLLRILKALDYLFDPKRDESKFRSDGENKENSEPSKSSKADLVTMLYEDPAFALLWDKLSECLRTIHQAAGMVNVASILLPLVEALMVVCTNITIKEATLTKTAKDFAVSCPAPESHMESLFFRFTEEHRKILNELVRQNPKLMSGTFQLLVKNPKVLEFDNKRNYFTRRLHQRSETRHPQPPLQLNVRRDQVFMDSFKFLSFKKGDEIKYGKLNIRFSGEEGVDAGGVTREWFQVMSRQMFNPDYALFIPVASDRTTFHPNKLSKVNEEHLMFFEFIGRIIGKALYEGRALDCHFSRAVYKRILGRTVSIKDMETLDLDYYKSLLWMLENDITEIITETMSVETDDFGVTEIVDLVPNGRNILVTEENKQEYVQLVVEHRLVGSVQSQLEKFLAGFHDIVPPELISIFTEQELELLISGLPDIDVDDWKDHTDYHNYQAASPQIQWFWRAVRSFDKEERAKLLQFVTGTSKVPLNGFGQLEGMNGFSRFNIHRDYGHKERLPSSHTCFNQLDLPEYEDYESLRKQLYTAMTAGSEYFGFA